MPLDLDFMPPDQIGHMSLNDLRGELQLAIKLKLGLEWVNRQLHWIQSIGFQLGGGGLLSFCPPENHCFGVSLALGFWSMRHSAIFEEEVDFQEHCVRHLWVVYSRGPWPNRLVGAYKTSLCCSIWILCPRTKLATCP
jgi:hypothetical protein